MMLMAKLIHNRISFRTKEAKIWLKIQPADVYVPVAKKMQWLQNKLQDENFNKWLTGQNIDKDKDRYLSLEFLLDAPQNNEHAYPLTIDLNKDSPFTRLVLKQVLYEYYKEKGYFVNTSPRVDDMEVLENMEAYEKVRGYNRYRAIRFLLKPKRDELVLQITGNRVLFSSDEVEVAAGQYFLNTQTGLYQKAYKQTRGLLKYSERLQEVPERFAYKRNYKELKAITDDLHANFHSPFFEKPSSKFIGVKTNDIFKVNPSTNQMVFSHEQKHVNAATGMREYGPYKKAPEADKTELLFIFQNSDHANKLYLHLKNGLRQFPGLMSYVGVPVALADKSEQLKYSNPENLSKELKKHIADELKDKEYTNKLAIVIGPFRKYESGKEESELYYQVKNQLLEKGIPSQFVSPKTILSQNFHFSLPNIAIAILAKLGGIPWKLYNKKGNELVVGFNTRKFNGTTFIGNAVFFDNEGQLGGVNGFSAENGQGIVQGLANAIKAYTANQGGPERMIIHYYKPASNEEIRAIDKLLQNNLGLDIPYAILEINDSKSKLDICFDMDFQFLIPISGTYVKIGRDEYLLFNNSRYGDKIASLYEQELPVKLKIAYMSSEVFSKRELISQVYEFSRINWKGLKQKSLPATITFSKMIADFAAHFNGEIPQNIAAQKRPWFL